MASFRRLSMKRLANLWPQVTAFDNLYPAWCKAQRGKKSKNAVTAFSLNLEAELLRLQSDLPAWGIPAIYHLRAQGEGDCRRAIPRPGGTPRFAQCGRAVAGQTIYLRFLRLPQGQGRTSRSGALSTVGESYRYALKMDIRQYFPSIDHELLQEKLGRGW